MIEGLDISHHQGLILWDEVPAKYKWIAMKCSEASGFTDPMFAFNHERAKETGRRVIPYHFFRGNHGVAFQKDRWMSAIADREIDAIALDVETQDGVSVQTLRNRVYWCLREMKSYGVPVLVYTADWFWSVPLDRHVLPISPPNSDDPEEDPEIIASGWHLWVAHWRAVNEDRLPDESDFEQGFPVLPHGWRRSDDTIERNWSLWQYTSRGHVPGIEGNVDKNVMQPLFWEEIGGDVIEEPEPIPVDLEPRVEKLEAWVESYER